MSEKSAGRVFRFGGFEANERSGELRKQGIRIKLHSQPFQVLIMLLENPSELVTREEMRTRLWGEGTFVDFDHSLNTAINKLRDALEDSASTPRYVETVAGKGYRFIAPVMVIAPVMQAKEERVATGADVEPPRASTANSSPGATSRAAELAKTSAEDVPNSSLDRLLAAPDELPVSPRMLVRSLLLLSQAMYLAFYVGALANLDEIHDIFVDANLFSPSALISALVATAVVLIPIRLFILTAVAFSIQQLPLKFKRMFPLLLIFDLLWALSPLLLIHHVNVGLALAMVAALVYMPFAQRSLVLMFARHSRN